MQPGQTSWEQEPADAALAARLRYADDRRPGLRRIGTAGNFVYLLPGGAPLTDPGQLARIEALGIPPAWTDVWIAPRPYYHIQATGRDAKGRKQYKYHARWREVRDEAKFNKMIDFGESLPEIRERVRRDLARSGLPRTKVLAAVTALLDITHLRIGNEEYARENQTYGLTTLRNDHVAVKGSAIHVEFIGKAHKRHMVDLSDRRLARVIRRCRDLPGQELFTYLENGEPRPVNSDDVNEYLREVSGRDFSAKDFRTWAGTLVAARALWETGTVDCRTTAKRQVTAAIRAAAGHLGNTPAVCRKSYVHPAVIGAYLDGTLFQGSSEPSRPAPSLAALEQEEERLLRFLRRVAGIHANELGAA
ncbi:MAG: DNA topoisomerase IB [Chloroflexota bacterium]